MQVPTIQVPWLLHVMSMHWLVGTSHSAPFQPLWHMQRPLRYWPFPLHSTGQAALKRADSIHPFEWSPPTIASKNSECELNLAMSLWPEWLKVCCAAYNMQHKLSLHPDVQWRCNPNSNKIKPQVSNLFTITAVTVENKKEKKKSGIKIVKYAAEQHIDNRWQYVQRWNQNKHTTIILTHCLNLFFLFIFNLPKKALISIIKGMSHYWSVKLKLHSLYSYSIFHLYITQWGW